MNSLTWLRRYGVAVLLGVVLLGGTVTAASAATPSRVNALSCAQNGGYATIPAGTEVEVRLGNILGNRGLATDFTRMQRTTLSINGGSLIDISAFWAQPEPTNVAPYGDIWITRLIYDTGVVLAAAESMHFQFVLTEPHLYLDGLTFVNGVSGRPQLFPPNVYTYDCTVMGV